MKQKNKKSSNKLGKNMDYGLGKQSKDLVRMGLGITVAAAALGVGMNAISQASS